MFTCLTVLGASSRLEVRVQGAPPWLGHRRELAAGLRSAEEEKLSVKFGAVVLLLGAASLSQAQSGLGGFGGPSILGRGSGGAGRQSDGLRIRPYLGVNAIYDSGLTSVAPGSDGSIFTRGAAGIEVHGGLYGTKEWKRHQLQVSYTGDYRGYNNQQIWNGTDQSLSLSYSTILTKRLSFEGTVSAGTTNRAFGGLSQPSLTDSIFQPGLPVNSLFDVRTNYGSANGAITYNFSPRTSVSFSGGGYLVKRSNSALFGVNGVQARADLTRRINKRTSVGVDYSFMTFQFSRAFGDSYVHGVGAFVARSIGRYWEVTARAGVLQVELLGKRQVAIDPIIAQIIGVTSGEEVFYSKNMLGSGQVGLTRTSRQGTIYLQGSRSVNPGNGIILTSQSDSLSTGYNRRLSRTLNLDASYNYSRLRGLGLITGTFSTHSAGVGLGWQVARYAQVTARFDRRNTDTTSATSFSLNGNRVAVGITFTPADVPVSLW